MIKSYAISDAAAHNEQVCHSETKVMPLVMQLQHATHKIEQTLCICTVHELYSTIQRMAKPALSMLSLTTNITTNNYL